MLRTDTSALVHPSARVKQTDRSTSWLVEYGVPKGSVLGPILFFLYMTRLDEIFSCHSVGHHAFAGDTQLQQSCTPDLVQSSVRGKEECVSEVKSWMTENKLQINDGKTEAMPVTSRRASTAGSVPTSLRVGLSNIKFASQVKNLGVTIDCYLTLHQHVTNACASAYVELCRIASICQHLSCETTKTLISTFVFSKTSH